MSPRMRKQATRLTFRPLCSGDVIPIAPADEGFSRNERVGIRRTAVRQVSPIRILLVCDRPIEREGIRLIVTNQPDMILVGCTDVDVEQLASSKNAADIILFDLEFETPDALALLPRVVAAARRGRVLVLASAGKEEVTRRIAFLGAMGVVSKDQGVETLVQAIKKVHSGEIWFDGAVVASLIRQIAQPVRQPRDDDAALRISSLTRREREVIQLLGQGMNAEALAKRLFISETTARHHLTSILEKLGIHDRFDLVFYAYRHRLAVPPACSEFSNSA